MKAGVLLALDVLHPSSKAQASNSPASIVPPSTAPSPMPRSSSPGFSNLQVKSLEEAIEWVKRGPNCSADDYEVEIRQVFEFKMGKCGHQFGLEMEQSASGRNRLPAGRTSPVPTALPLSSWVATIDV